MEKINITIKRKKYVTFTFLETDILVDPYIDVNTKTMLVTTYVDAIVSAPNEIAGYLEAEYGLKLGIIELLTNVNIKDITLDEIVCSGLWDEVCSKVINYMELRDDIDRILEQVKYSQSLVSTINKLVKQISELLENVKNLDMSQEGITSLLGRFNTELEKLNHIGELPVPVITPAEKRISKAKTKKTKEILQ